MCFGCSKELSHETFLAFRVNFMLNGDEQTFDNPEASPKFCLLIHLLSLLPLDQLYIQYVISIRPSWGSNQQPHCPVADTVTLLYCGW